VIARVWKGYAKPDHADAYQSMLVPDLLPGLSATPGFRGSYLLRRHAGDEVEFVTIILWDSLDDVKAAVGGDYERAVVPPERRQHLSRYDDRAAHYDVVSARDAARSR
jgi:heme-degrading monooxygenase HmoA